VPEKNVLPQNLLNRAFVLPALCALALAASCTRSGPQPAPFVPQISYRVSFLSGDSLHVCATIACDRGAGLQKILFPPFDADNPRLGFYGNNIRNLRLTGAYIEDSLRFSPWADDSMQAILVRAAQASFTVEYDVTFPYGPGGGMRTVLPGTSGTDDWYYQGNYIFCVPDYAETKPGLWRKNIDAAVSITAPAGRKMYGVLSGEFSANTVYELLFLQFAVTDRAWQCSGSSSYYAVLSSRDAQPEFSALVCADLAKTDSLCAGLFPPLSAPHTVIIQDSGSGMEGLFSFYLQNWSAYDYQNSLRSVTSHEALHWWVGIRTGDLDDPWWKEATASYLGFELGGAIGFSKDTIRHQLVRNFAGNPMVEQKAMADPYVRDHLFHPDSNINAIALVYGKGTQVNMILDKILRQATNNTATLFSKPGALCTHYDHGAFSRAGFRAVLEQGTGLDLSDFFSRYVDGVGPLDTFLLAQTFAWLDSAGAFTGKP
jgi:hypothetical protein